MSKISSIYLSREQYTRMKEVCEKEGCTPYSLAKKALVDHIMAYPLEKPPASEKEPLKQDLGEPAIEEEPEPETPKVDPEDVAERVLKILEGE